MNANSIEVEIINLGKYITTGTLDIHSEEVLWLISRHKSKNQTYNRNIYGKIKFTIERELKASFKCHPFHKSNTWLKNIFHIDQFGSNSFIEWSSQLSKDGK